MVLRYDFGRLAKSQPLSSGGARVPARLTRTGVFVYRTADGGERRELRHPDDVFAADSLSTLPYAAVTVDHPSTPVDTTNWNRLSVGTVSEGVRADGIYVASDLVVQESKALGRIDSGDLQETSCGYSCEIEMVAGVYQGERYDARQRNIRYNHVALGPAGWGRAGSEVSIRLDSGDAIAIETIRKQETTNMKMITIDGIAYDVTTEQFTQALERKDAREKAERDKLQAERSAALAECDKHKKDAADLQVKLDSKTEQDNAAIERLAALRVDSTAVLGKDFDYSGKSEVEIMKAVISKNDAAAKLDGASDDYIRGLYASAKTIVMKKPNTIGAVFDFKSDLIEDSKDDEPMPGMGALSMSKDR